ncbi:MAG: RES family NAD+ phosphorylase, partial [Solirubrobacterales bacterium]
RSMAREKSPPVVDVDEIAHRYSSYDTPFWARENTLPGRWHVRGGGPTQYLSLSTDGAWAELIRNERLTSEDEIAMVSVQMWAVAVNQAMVVDYSTFERAEAGGFDPDALVDEDYARCQQEGARLRGLNYGGVLSPSAALPGAVNLTLFGPRTASTWSRPPLLASSLPATVIAKGAPPPGLLGQVRQVGAPHAGLIAYKSARTRNGD